MVLKAKLKLSSKKVAARRLQAQKQITKVMLRRSMEK